MTAAVANAFALNDDDDALDPVDREALERALAESLKDPQRAGQITSMLADGWEQAAKFAAYSLQCDRLNLSPWECAPCHGYLLDSDRVVRDPQGGALADQLTDAGLSVWEPDPSGALAKAARRRTKSRRAGPSFNRNRR
jgi:hypothetical protein